MTTHLFTFDAPEPLATAAADLLAEDPRLGADAAGAFDLGRSVWRVEAYFATRPDHATLVDRLSGALDDAGFSAEDIAARLTSAVLRPFDDTDWSMIGLDALPPIIAGGFRVFGEHNRPAPHELRCRDLVIEASTAFGTGDHASTWLSLQAIDRLLRFRRPRRVLDIGTGTGILGLAVLKSAPGATVIATDIDPVAIRMAEANRRTNAAVGRFVANLADGLSLNSTRLAAPYDLVLANILPGPLTRLAGPIARSTARGGHVVVAGLRLAEEPHIVSAYAAWGLRFVERSIAKEWVSLTFTKPHRGLTVAERPGPAHPRRCM